MNAKGPVFKYGDNIDTDVIIPARYLNTQSAAELASHCMEDIDKSFVARVKAGDIMVGGENFGCGSSREHAPVAIKASGISCVIAKSFARIFYRNAINIGLPILECPAASEAINEGDVVAIIGPSGCGKSTLLRIIGNLDKPTSGTIEYRDGADQQMGFVFQDSVLLPWKNVRQNAEFPLVIQKKQTKENEEKLDELLELAGLSEFKTALPRELSGGMKQRVSIVRALSYDAPLLLMDEPFGALDALTRDHLNEELLKIWQKTKKTVIFVTHSIEEATFLSDRVLVMSARPGRVKEMVEIDLPRPRGEATRNDPKFTEYNKYLRGIIG